MKHRNLAIACVLALMVAVGIYMLLPTLTIDRYGDSWRFHVSSLPFVYHNQRGAYPRDLTETLPYLQMRLPRCHSEIHRIDDTHYRVLLDCPHAKLVYHVEYRLDPNGQLEAYHVRR